MGTFNDEKRKLKKQWSKFKRDLKKSKNELKKAIKEKKSQNCDICEFKGEQCRGDKNKKRNGKKCKSFFVLPARKRNRQLYMGVDMANGNKQTIIYVLQKDSKGIFHIINSNSVAINELIRDGESIRATLLKNLRFIPVALKGKRKE